MQRYESRLVTLEVPDNWQDRSITAFAAPSEQGIKVAPNIVVTRDSAEGSERVASYADRQLVEMAKRLDSFNLIHRTEGTLAGLPSVELLFSWNGSSGLLQQKQVFVITRQRAVISVVATALKDSFAKMEPTFNSILSSLKFPPPG